MVLCGRLEPFLGMRVTEVGRALWFSDVDLNLPWHACYRSVKGTVALWGRLEPFLGMHVTEV